MVALNSKQFSLASVQSFVYTQSLVSIEFFVYTQLNVKTIQTIQSS